MQSPVWDDPHAPWDFVAKVRTVSVAKKVLVLPGGVSLCKPPRTEPAHRILEPSRHTATELSRTEPARPTALPNSRIANVQDNRHAIFQSKCIVFFGVFIDSPLQ